MSSVFKIYSPEDCDFYYDGELQGHIDGNSKKAFRFEVERKGVYRLEFINSEYQTELMMKVSIDADEEREVELDFNEVNEPAISEREKIIIAIEQDYGLEERLRDEIISAISDNGVITIPKGVRKIGHGAFRHCNSLNSITIPKGVTVIGASAFSGCRCLSCIYIPDGVTSIGGCAFNGCHNMASISIPDSVKEIGESAFYGCRSLTHITIPDGVTTIKECAFVCCRTLTSITIPNSVKEIGVMAFYACSSLTSVYCKATTPPKLDGSSLQNNASFLKIYVPKSKGSIVLEAYKSADGWKDYADMIEEYDFGNE